MFQLNQKSIQKLGLVLILSLCSFVALQAQRTAGSVGIGAQFGQPTGLSLKVYNPNGLSPDVLLAWDLNDFFFINVHGLVERHIDSGGNFHYFIGPGVFAGIRDSNNEILEGNDNFAAGISGNFGLNVLLGTVEIYGQVTPRLELIDKTSSDIGGGLGIRFYFK